MAKSNTICLIASCLLLFSLQIISAEDGPPGLTADSLLPTEGQDPLSGIAQAGDESPSSVGENPRLPTYGTFILGETLLPGSGLWRLGRKRDAILVGSLCIPLIAAGQGLIWYYYLYPQGGIVSGASPGYPFQTASRDVSSDWILGVGQILDFSGRAIAAWSALSSHEAYVAARDGRLSQALEGSLELIAAPFSPAAVSPSVLPIVFIINAAFLPSDAAERFASFFRAERRAYWGIELSPLGSLGLAAASMALKSLASGLGGEILYRGLFLRRDGIGVSIIAGGADSLLGLVSPGRPVAKTLMATGTGLALGLYGAALSVSDGGRLRKPIALRFWLDWSQSLLGYVLYPDDQDSGLVGLRIEY